MRYHPLLTPVPKKLISHGQAQFGLFQDTVPELNWQDAQITTSMDQPLSRWQRYFGFKQFQFVCIQTADWVLAIAIADVRYVNSGFAYFFHVGQDSIEYSHLAPLAWGSQMSASPCSGEARLGSATKHWMLEPTAAGWKITLQTKRLQAHLMLHRQAQAALALCAPTGYAGMTYTEKNNALAVSGELSVDGKPVDVTQARGGYDFSAGWMRRQTSWRWASIQASLDGIPFGLNLAAGVNETGLCENALWYQAQCQHLSPAQFQFDRQQDSPWQITTLCGELNLRFEADFCRRERLAVGLLASNFRQYVGRFYGTVTLASGGSLTLDGVRGLVEDHYAKW